MDRDLVKRPFFMEKKHFLVEMKAAMTELIRGWGFRLQQIL